MIDVSLGVGRNTGIEFDSIALFDATPHLTHLEPDVICCLLTGIHEHNVLQKHSWLWEPMPIRDCAET